MTLLSNFYGILFRPSRTFSRLANEYNTALLVQGLLVYLIATLISDKLALSSIINSAISWITMVTLIFLIGYVFKLEAKDYGKLICLCCFATAPLIFTAPLKLLGDSYPGLKTWFGIALQFWMLNLYILAVARACEIQKRKVILFFSIPILLLIALLTGSLIQILFAL